MKNIFKDRCLSFNSLYAGQGGNNFSKSCQLIESSKSPYYCLYYRETWNLLSLVLDAKFLFIVSFLILNNNKNIGTGVKIVIKFHTNLVNCKLQMNQMTQKSKLANSWHMFIQISNIKDVRRQETSSWKKVYVSSMEEQQKYNGAFPISKATLIQFIVTIDQKYLGIGSYTTGKYSFYCGNFPLNCITWFVRNKLVAAWNINIHLLSVFTFFLLLIIRNVIIIIIVVVPFLSFS